MSVFKTSFVALAITPQFTSVLTAPAVREGATLSIRAANIVKNDLSAADVDCYEDMNTCVHKPHGNVKQNSSTGTIELAKSPPGPFLGYLEARRGDALQNISLAGQG
ncbi:hypothetical protein DM02DRAFT_658811 [Periconia macrospinosa]|uniref:Uncharacterized protein n=1 Tax=Periconia macrospinosa TaxID=97972 RepID=A0A2V1DFR0_9PLEO|nr:hypothetical protein DM02DRAFT_658811 [Periconia macrospinosa]